MEATPDVEGRPLHTVSWLSTAPILPSRWLRGNVVPTVRANLLAAECT
jgi:hypothetical protein